MAFFEDIGKKITNAGQGVAQQTKNLTDTTRLNAKISEHKKEMSQLLFEMGNDYYKKHRKDTDCEEQEYIDQLNVLFREILKCQQEIEAIKNSAACKVCGARIAEGAVFCMSCGAKIGAEEVEDAEVDDETIRKCPTCGAPVDEDSVFCMACGTKLEDNTDEYSDEAEYEDEEESVRVCPTCGTEAEDDDMFCMICGTKL